MSCGFFYALKRSDIFGKEILELLFVQERIYHLENHGGSFKLWRFFFIHGLLYVLPNPLNRITAATDNTRRFGLSNLRYDKNGNITDLTRGGHLKEMPDWDKDDDFGTMDQLDYQYFDGSNRLRSVTDGISKNDTSGKGEFVDGNKDGDDYVYDPNGNMTQDLNKGIKGTTPTEKGIEYNHLNLPTLVRVNNGADVGTISYIYDATGVKLRKNVLKNGSNTPTDYAGNYIYESGKLQFFNQPEGYVEPKNPDNLNQGYDYIYQYSDHLGNVRLSYKDNNGTTEILSENNYYPFGLEHKGYNTVVTSTSPAQNYTYNGKEKQEELGLNWHDYGARNYDSSLGRWMNLDNHASSYLEYSPYNYAINNPINVIDPDGNDIYILIWATDRNNNKYGHTGIAVDNYKTQNKKDANGNDVLDKNGNVVTEQVKDGTFTYYDLWPGVDNDGDGVGDDFGSAGPNLKDSFIGMPAYYQNNSIHSLSDLINNDPSGQEGYAPDGAIKLNADYGETMETIDDLTAHIKSNKNYKSALNNCSSFCLKGTLEPLDKLGIFTSTGAMESYLGGYTKIVTPNQLYKYLLEIVNSNPTEGRVVKSPGSKVDEKFTSNKEIKGN